MPLQPDAKPSCANPEYDPEWWYPEHTTRGGSPSPAARAAQERTIENAVLAMKICQECPLFRDNSCLEYAMEDTHTIDYGIYGGTLPVERRKSVGMLQGVHDRSVMWVHIRQKATRAGVLPVKVTMRERPKTSTFQFIDRQHVAKDTSSDFWE